MTETTDTDVPEPEGGKRTSIPFAELKPGVKVRHETFPPELVERMRQVFYRLRPLRGGKLKDWIEGFKYDANPESEVAIWESMMDYLDDRAAQLQPPASIDEKREALQEMLAKSLHLYVDPETGVEMVKGVVVDDPDTPAPAWLEANPEKP